MRESFFEAQTLGIGKLLKEGEAFVVPAHQRDYSWSEDEIDQLLTDVEAARAERREDYFIGLMVFVRRGDEEYTIVDGQQRIATAVILLASIRTWLKKHGFKEDATQIQTEYIGLRRLGKKTVEPRLVLNYNNNGLFERFVVDGAPSSEIETELKALKRYDASRKLLQAILFCGGKVEEIARVEECDVGQAAENLFEFVDYLTDSVKVVRVTVPSEANAYVVFETLNYRGVDLSMLDLVKNHLFGLAEAHSRELDAQWRWAQMMNNVADVKPEDFLKVYWTSRHGRVQRAQLFGRFAGTVTSWREGYEVLDDMLDTSQLYAALEVADHAVWDKVSASRGHVRALRVLGGRQVHPVLLSALEKLSDRELGRLLRLLEVLIVRYQLIGGLRTGRLEIACASLAHAIYREEVKTAAEALAAVRDIFPSDGEFKAAFEEKEERTSSKAKYLLRKLEGHARDVQKGMTARELEPPESLTVEHILPRNPGDEWAAALEADPALADECVYRLGNLCLLTGVNRRLGGKAFSEKRRVFEESDLLVTREVAEWADWNREAIVDRQRRMAKRAVSAWRFQ